jgi:hypothetical protein
MAGVLLALVLIVLIAVLVRWAWSLPPGPPVAGVLPGRPLPARERARRERAIAAARWSTAHDEVDGETRVLLRRTCTGPDGRPEVLEERLFDSFPARDPMWEAKFTETMSNARFRCRYLNAEEGQPE